MGEKHGFDKPMGGFVQPKSAAMSSAFRGHMVAASGEFVGTFMFLFLAFLGHIMSVTLRTEHAPGAQNDNQTVIFIAMSYGLSLLVTAWTLYRVSGGLFRFVPNPAVTVGLIITGALPPVRGLILMPAQILGAICAAAVVSGIIPGDISATETTLSTGVSVAQGLFLEMFLTAQLVLTVLILAAEKSKDTFIAPIGIGLALFVAEIAGVYYTGASLNPARSFGPCVIAAQFQTYHWIYWIGPLLGALLAGAYYHFIKFFNYEDANPGQDSAGGDFDEISRSRSGMSGYEDPQRVESGTNRKRNAQNGIFKDPNRPSYSQDGAAPDPNRPRLNSRIESGTMHPGFDTYER